MEQGNLALRRPSRRDLQGLLDDMGRWYAVALRLEASADPTDVHIAHIARLLACRCAFAAAHCVHRTKKVAIPDAALDRIHASAISGDQQYLVDMIPEDV